MLELYHHGSSACAAKVRFALAEKQLGWTGHYIDILAGGALIGSGEVVIIEEIVGIRITDFKEAD